MMSQSRAARFATHRKKLIASVIFWCIFHAPFVRNDNRFLIAGTAGIVEKSRGNGKKLNL
jgi:hypothetical protein